MFHTTVCENIGMSPCTGLPLASPKPSKVRFNAEEIRLSVDQSKFKILSGCERSLETTLILKSLDICNFKPSIKDTKSGHKLLIVQ